MKTTESVKNEETKLAEQELIDLPVDVEQAVETKAGSTVLISSPAQGKHIRLDF